MRYSTQLSINLKYLESNYNKLRKLAPSNEVIFMVKANAYGHGLEEVVRFSDQEMGIHQFGVASVGEAMQLRINQPDLQCELLVFSDTEIGNDSYRECYTNHRITPVIHQFSQLELFLQETDFKFVPLVLKFDTGMNRLGIPIEKITEVVRLLKKHGRTEVDHLMTHFSSSFLKLKENDRTHRQYGLFVELKKTLQSGGISVNKTSCANSGAIEQQFALEESHIRPGLMMYGPRSVGSFRPGDGIWKGESICRLKSTIISMNPIKKGAPVGYGGHVCHKDGLLVNLPIGYGDGFLTYYSGLKLKHRSHEYQVLGRVNMDLISLLFESTAAADLKVGDEIVFWDHDQQSIVDFSNQAKTIPYQVYTAITSRVPREYRYQ
jgi:alanine racemase